MPLYEYECNECGLRHDMFRPVDNRDNHLDCDCGGACERVISRPNVNPDIFDSYYDPNLAPKHSQDGQGSWVKSRQHRKELMRKFGLTEIG